MKQKYFIDSHKALTGLVVLLMIAIYNQWTNTTAWLYLALHGTYGILWVLKSNIFPDKSWEQEISWGYGLVNLVALSLYWISPWLIISQSVHVPAWYLGMCVSLYIFGIFFHFTTDMQKYIALKLQPAHLITTGMATHCRNMNYFGELLIYLGFGLLAMHWLPIVILFLYVMIVWLPNMYRKDKSLARYSEFEVYKERSSLFIPFL